MNPNFRTTLRNLARFIHTPAPAPAAPAPAADDEEMPEWAKRISARISALDESVTALTGRVNWLIGGGLLITLLAEILSRLLTTKLPPVP